MGGGGFLALTLYYIDIGHTFGFNTNERFATKQWEIITL